MYSLFPFYFDNQHMHMLTVFQWNFDMQDFFEDVGPLVSLQLGGSAMDGLLKIFDSYVNLLISGLPGSVDDEVNLEGLGNKIVRMAETEEEQLALLANASLLAEELLPRAATKLYSMNPVRGPDRQNRAAEQREWKRKLHRTVDKLRDSFCRQHALDLIFTDNGDSHLSADMYINMDNTVEDPEWVPSLIFQVFPCFLACNGRSWKSICRMLHHANFPKKLSSSASSHPQFIAGIIWKIK